MKALSKILDILFMSEIKKIRKKDKVPGSLYILLIHHVREEGEEGGCHINIIEGKKHPSVILICFYHFCKDSAGHGCSLPYYPEVLKDALYPEFRISS